MGDDELAASRTKLKSLVRLVDPNAQLVPEVEEVLIELSTKFVEQAAKYATRLAQHRGSNKLELPDLRMYVETVLGVHVPGFGSSANGIAPSGLTASANQRGLPGKASEEHLARLKLRKRAHVTLSDDFSASVGGPSNAAKRPKT
eukprot:CAMPEP_0184517228 /NCGR_PEP_ID=MMETSP0198_2-20121128/5446_1 /TAXON_ID=1112570 /ORGANISM="Thraustochytrium sp., Strain LLF1b" /LENGTH=144 /DNA_ID=CAMNT_0026907593 /DNA_START=147 /DNA_END=581 /DNA_ORIENTATION=-